jgi:putative ABC transport system permease protein
MKQTLRITLANLAALPHRLGASLVVCVGIGGVVAVLISVLAMATGLRNTLQAVGSPDRAVVVREGAISETLSSLSRDELVALDNAPGIAGGAADRRISPEVVWTETFQRSPDLGRGTALIRGVTPAGRAVHDEFAITAGRDLQPGLRELLVGAMAVREFDDLHLDAEPFFLGTRWKVVGIFASGGDARESELITDAATLLSALSRADYNSATVTLSDPAALAALKAALEDNPALNVDVQRESDYYEEQSQQISRPLFVVAYVVGGIMALGALFGALNTMYAAVSARAVEIATLRALGFGAVPVVVSVLIEAVVLAFIGACLGGAVAWLLFHGNAFSTTSGFGRVVLDLDVGWELFAVGIVWACVIGFIGGLLPAWRAARLPIAEGLRVAV